MFLDDGSGEGETALAVGPSGRVKAVWTLREERGGTKQSREVGCPCPDRRSPLRAPDLPKPGSDESRHTTESLLDAPQVRIRVGPPRPAAGSAGASSSGAGASAPPAGAPPGDEAAAPACIAGVPLCVRRLRLRRVDDELREMFGDDEEEPPGSPEGALEAMAQGPTRLQAFTGETIDLSPFVLEVRDPKRNDVQKSRRTVAAPREAAAHAAAARCSMRPPSPPLVVRPQVMSGGDQGAAAIDFGLDATAVITGKHLDPEGTWNFKARGRLLLFPLRLRKVSRPSHLSRLAPPSRLQCEVPVVNGTARLAEKTVALPSRDGPCALEVSIVSRHGVVVAVSTPCHAVAFPSQTAPARQRTGRQLISRDASADSPARARGLSICRLRGATASRAARTPAQRCWFGRCRSPRLSAPKSGGRR